MRERGTCAASRTSDGSRARTAPAIFRSDFVQCCSLRASTNDTLAPFTIRATTWRGVTLENISTFSSPWLAVAEGDPLAVVGSTKGLHGACPSGVRRKQALRCCTAPPRGQPDEASAIAAASRLTHRVARFTPAGAGLGLR